MHRPSPIKLVALAIALIGADARGQEGFRYAQPKPGSKVAKSARVHRDDAEVTILDTWLVRQSSLPGANHRQITAIVEDIALYSTGTMRWKFAIYNRGSSRDNFIFDFPNCYVVDVEGNVIKATGWELTQNYGTMTRVGLPAEAKATFWIEFAAPARPTKAFKVALVCEAGFATLPNEFAPFRVTLAEPLSVGGGKAEGPRAEPEPEPAGGLKVEDAASPAGERPAGTTRAPEPMKGVVGRPSSEAMQAMLAPSREGRRYEGDIVANPGGRLPGGILFERRSKDRLLSARIFSRSGTIDVELVGAICEEVSAPGGLVFRFEDRAKVEYLFQLSGNVLTGRDSAGNRYSFLWRK